MAPAGGGSRAAGSGSLAQVETIAPVERLSAELAAYWDQQPKAAGALLCERDEESSFVRVVAPPLKKKWLTSTDLEMFVAEPPEAGDSPRWRAAVDELRPRGWQSNSYDEPLFRATPVPDGRTPELARWVVDELVVALRVAHGMTDVDGLHWVWG